MDNETKQLVQAMNFACKAHGDKKYGDLPYARHLAHVEDVLHRFSFNDNDLLVAAWLHDTIEDTVTNLAEIKKLFGRDVAMLVDAVTDGAGSNRSERKAATYPKLRAYPRAIILKLADRIANIESALVSNNKIIGMYRKEQQTVKDELSKTINLLTYQTDEPVLDMLMYIDRLLEMK